MKNKYIGSDFNDFLKEDGIHEEVNFIATKRVISYQLKQAIKEKKITKTQLAQKMKTSRAVVNRILDPKNESLTLSSLENIASALDKKIEISIH